MKNFVGFVDRKWGIHDYIAAVAELVCSLCTREIGVVLQSRQTYFIESGSESSTAKCSATGVRVMGPWI